MAEPVKLPKPIVDALDKMFELGVPIKSKIIKLHVAEPDGWKDHCTPLNGMDLEHLIKAVYIGYEIEQTPEDKVREFCQSMINQNRQDMFNAVRSVLDLLNIKIKGVNAE